MPVTDTAPSLRRISLTVRQDRTTKGLREAWQGGGAAVVSTRTATLVSERPLESGAVPRGGRRVRLSATGVVIVGAAMVGLALRAYQLSLLAFLLGVTEYDDGPFFG